MVSGFLVYGLVFLPLVLTVWCLASVKAALKLRPVLMFFHFYCAIGSLVAAVASLALEEDPLKLFFLADTSTYLFFQALMGVVLLAYTLLLICALALSRNQCEFISRLLQLAGCCLVASVYYEVAWEPSMLDKPPVVLFPDQLAAPYLASTAVFCLVVVLEQVQRRSVAADPTVPRTRAEDDRMVLELEAGGDLGGPSCLPGVQPAKAE